MSPAPFLADDSATLYLGKAEAVLPTLPDASVDAIVTDPPAAIAFMGRDWDHNRGGRDKWVAWLTEVLAEATRCLKPGGHALIWALPRTSHWTAWAIEDAGLYIHDCVLHLFGSGFPKSLDVGKAIDTAAGAEREVIDRRTRKATGRMAQGDGGYAFGEEFAVTSPATAHAARWDGWGTALKPGQEIWWLARKPLSGTVAQTVLEHGTGALNIAATRIQGSADNARTNKGGYLAFDRGERPDKPYTGDAGRWPTNVVFTHSPDCDIRDEGDGGIRIEGPCVEGCPVAELDRQSGITGSSFRLNKGERTGGIYGNGFGPSGPDGSRGHEDIGGASRFFPVFRYEAKAPASERPRVDGIAHETVKPLALMRWLVRLITPPGGLVLDPFLGSGTTAEACVIEGFRCVGIEHDERYIPLIKARLTKPLQPTLGFEEGIA